MIGSEAFADSLGGNMRFSPRSPSLREATTSRSAAGETAEAGEVRRVETLEDASQLDRKRWKTRVELVNAIFEYLEIFHNRQRRHSALGMTSPVEFEARHQTAAA